MRHVESLPFLSDDELESSLVRGTSEQSAYLAWWLSVLAEFDRREVWRAAGFVSCVAWLMARCGSSGRTARDHVAVAHRLESAPLTRQAFAKGQLSYSKVRALCRVVRRDNEEFLVGLAADMTASQLDRHVRAYEATQRAAGRTPEAYDALEEQCGLTRSEGPNGLVRYELVMTPLDALVFERAAEFGMDVARRKQRREDKAAREDGREPEERPKPAVARRRLDGLMTAVRRGLVQAELDPTPADNPFLLLFHIRQGEAFINDAGELDLGHGFTVPRYLVDAMGCTSMVQSVLVDGHDRPLDLGRRARVASKMQKLAKGSQHTTCGWPGCDIPYEWCELHHVAWWGRDQGRTDLANFVPLCRRHHPFVHRDGWSLVVGDEGSAVVAISPSGRRVTDSWALTDDAVAADALVARLDDLGVRNGVSDEDRFASLAGRWGGERMTAWARAEIGSAVADACDVPELLADVDVIVTTDRGRRAEPPTAA